MDPIHEPPGADAGDDAVAARPEAPRRPPLRGGVGDVIGGALVGVDYQLFRATKPPAVLVESAKPIRGLSGEGGAMLSIGFPDDVVAEADPPSDHPAAGDTGLR